MYDWCSWITFATDSPVSLSRILIASQDRHLERVLLQYTCEWCKCIKKNGEPWIVGLAAQMIGAGSSRCEIDIIAGWSEKWARHPLAVHFCSLEHKSNYIRALFGGMSAPVQQRRVRARKSESNLSARQEAANHRPETGLATKERARRSQAVAKRVARMPAEGTFDARDRVRAHGLSIRVDDSGISVLSTTDDLGAFYGGA